MVSSIENDYYFLNIKTSGYLIIFNDIDSN